MAMFPPSRFLLEQCIACKSQDRFVSVVMHNKNLSKFAATEINLGDLMLFHKVKSDFWKTGVECLYHEIYQKIQKIEDRLNSKKIKMSLPKENT